MTRFLLTEPQFPQTDGDFLQIPVTRYRVTGVTCRSEQVELAFDSELLRFVLRTKAGDQSFSE